MYEVYNNKDTGRIEVVLRGDEGIMSPIARMDAQLEPESAMAHALIIRNLLNQHMAQKGNVREDQG